MIRDRGKRLLLLAGSGESRALAQALAWREGVTLEVRLARPMRGRAFPVAATTGGFGGAEGFRAFLDDWKPDAVIDATHPYAESITARTAGICRSLGLPLLHHERAPWQAAKGDDWVEIDSPEACRSLIPEGACVFLGTGRAGLERFGCLEGRRVICRQLDAADGPFPFEGGEFIVSVPPFSVEAEMRLFHRLEVDWLVVKNAGGEGARPKLDAARAMGLPVAMLARPPEPEGVTRAETLQAAMDWIEAL
ncbi:MAG: precorrin-6A/cobalt-precorrin-6A reductase [Vannielia sp.]|uniref:precorrin-6A/cobalt-precorrin-6A reductase n=1 Tax=Vannielia sp. TaxID=2813045 RepID=UPI003B8E32FA